MGQYQDVFRRVEKKYLLPQDTYQELSRRLKGAIKEDEYGKTSICNIYYDTPDSRLIRASLEKPVYKEKLRLRSYGVPREDSTVFVELKKKYKGVVYKRRADMTLVQARAFLNQRLLLQPQASQIQREISWVLGYYPNLGPAMFVSYERTAAYGMEDPGLRITFDEHILYRTQQLELRAGIWGRELLKPGMRLMEIKIGGSMPLWLAGILDDLHIYPVSFSKYGGAYCQLLQTGNGTASHTGGNVSYAS